LSLFDNNFLGEITVNEKQKICVFKSLQGAKNLTPSEGLGVDFPTIGYSKQQIKTYILNSQCNPLSHFS
jgi:hypothetical protein